MTHAQFLAMAGALAGEAGTRGGLHRYFLSHQDRIWETGVHFGLWELRGRDIAEIGPFFSYVPFFLAGAGNRVTVLEGDDPAVEPLQPLYQRRGIPVVLLDLAGHFGAVSAPRSPLPLASGSFDVVNCWETMEHFNFNPVGFVREVHRVLKPGGIACVTVPNMARLECRARLLLGRSISPSVGSYEEFYDYHHGKFLGWHWREYVLPDLVELFTRNGFEIARASHALAFMHEEPLSAGRRLKRLLARAAFRLLPSSGTLCLLTARKPLESR